ncbi:MAG: acyl carrier protein [Bacteroidetes bacterium]|nr:MAG: acyl carrier protein [Bacteroidota bacterium]
MIDIRQYLPHRYPMQMVDTIVAITETDIATEFVVQGDNIFVKSSVLEEAGLIENMAQTCSAVVGQFYFSESNPTPNVIGYIGAIRSLDIVELPQVGQTVTSHARLVSKMDMGDFSMSTLECEARADDGLLAKANMNLFIKEMPK